MQATRGAISGTARSGAPPRRAAPPTVRARPRRPSITTRIRQPKASARTSAPPRPDPITRSDSEGGPKMLQFCNQYPQEVWVAIMWYHPNCPDGGDWEKAGWWHLYPGECKIVFGDDLEDLNRYFTFYAE